MEKAILAAGVGVVLMAQAQRPPPPPSWVPPVSTFLVFFESRSTEQSRIGRGAEESEIVAEAVRAARQQEVHRLCVLGYRDPTEPERISQDRVQRVGVELVQDGFSLDGLDRRDEGANVPGVFGGSTRLPDNQRRLVVIDFETPNRSC